jgi:hypothetical protein
MFSLRLSHKTSGVRRNTQKCVDLGHSKSLSVFGLVYGGARKPTPFTGAPSAGAGLRAGEHDRTLLLSQPKAAQLQMSYCYRFFLLLAAFVCYQLMFAKEVFEQSQLMLFAASCVCVLQVDVCQRSV